MTRALTHVGTALAGLVLATAVAAPATAQTVRIHDRVGDTRHGNGDVKWLRLHYGPHRLGVTLKWSANGDPAYFQDLYLDTAPKHPGPEALVSSNGDWEGWTVSLDGGWSVADGHERCSSRPGAVRYDFRHHLLHYSVPRTCLMAEGKAQPRRLRAALVTRGETEAAYDWVPGKRRFSRWVHRG